MGIFNIGSDNKQKKTGLRYDFFNYWFAILLDALPVEREEKMVLINKLEIALNRVFKDLINELAANESTEKVEYLPSKRHIRYPELELRQKFNGTEIYCKIRINPCLASDKDDGEHTKLWVIFYNKNSSDLLVDDILSLFKKLSDISDIVFKNIHETFKNILSKVDMKATDYKITMINASIHLESIEQMNEKEKSCLKLADTSKILEIKKKTTVGSNLIQDLEEIISDKSVSGSSNNPFKIIRAKSAWKNTTSRYYDTVARICATDRTISSAQIAIINKKENRQKILYHDPHFEAVDLSREL